MLVDVGYRNTHITPVVDGYTLLKDVERLELGGKHITDVIHESMVSFIISWFCGPLTDVFEILWLNALLLVFP